MHRSKRRKSTTFGWIVLGFLLVVSTPLFSMVEQPQGPMDSAMGSFAVPFTLMHLVDDANLIVVASYEQSLAVPTVVLVTPPPTATVAGQSTPYPTALPMVTGEIAETEVEIQSILRNDGKVSLLDHIWYARVGSLPTNATQTALDALDHFRIVWPADTEFLLFLGAVDGQSQYNIPYGACGRIILGATQATCSDANHTIPPFMEGLSGEEFLEAVEDEVNSPSSTWTPGPTNTPWY